MAGTNDVKSWEVHSAVAVLWLAGDPLNYGRTPCAFRRLLIGRDVGTAEAVPYQAAFKGVTSIFGERSSPRQARRLGLHGSWREIRSERKALFLRVEHLDGFERHVADDLKTFGAEFIHGVLGSVPENVVVAVVEIYEVGGRDAALHKG